ncbi:tRNA methyltransferase 10 homolog A-like [Sitophilus oryzae]|uniref:tRNA (guanine(9)-N(1))-methyltransferase n=1 Tax=Sitophilus oryzae TaxID=7048 RepID=A0A6J2Y6J7_SITOR|nr:tRNA methyltransferase 10 homolog A-like [Sitophilus oryzae]XP_030758841.1 tRNA methyltransferase 10 homolog A-like [Sitophilus oryzae]
MEPNRSYHTESSGHNNGEASHSSTQLSARQKEYLDWRQIRKNITKGETLDPSIQLSCKQKKYLDWLQAEKEKKARRKARWEARKEYARQHGIVKKKVVKVPEVITLMQDSTCDINICIDLSFIGLMTNRYKSETGRQIRKVYEENRAAKAPLHVHLTRYTGLAKERLRKRGVTQEADLHFHEGHYLDVFEKDRLIYLTSDSKNVLDRLEENKVYIIGGLSGHTKHKSLCYRTATSEGIAHAQLPIKSSFNIKSKKSRILHIYQVFQILLKVSEGKSFNEAVRIVFSNRQNILSDAAYYEEDGAYEEEFSD